MNTPPLIAITGGIGAGKSVVCRILRAMGYPVFDCDSEARILMDTDERIKHRLATEIAAEVIDGNGAIDRRLLADIVFADAAKLATLNAIVHTAVKERLTQWHHRAVRGVPATHTNRVPASHTGRVFVETAILFESGLNEIVDAEWRVVAPTEVRIARVMARNGLDRAAVEARIAAQNKTPEAGTRLPELYIITNDGHHAILPQIQNLL